MTGADAARRIVRFPQHDRPLPERSDFERVAGLPLVQMFVVGRSGSGLVHAFLDGHPEVLHVPHTFKYYDFVAANTDLEGADAAAWIDRFIASPLVAFLFDSSRSVIVGGRLGPGMGVTVTVDPAAFRSAFLNAVGGMQMDARRVFLAIVLAYGWAIGQDIAAAKVVFHHVHHGDWLWPQDLLERANYQPVRERRPEEILKADRYVVSVSEPEQAFNSIVRFVPQLGLTSGAQVETRELLIRLLAQDWLRLDRARRARLDVHAVRLEDLRNDAAGTMALCATWLGISPDVDALGKLTYYGFEWFGDIFTSPSSTVKPVGKRTPPPWQDRNYLHTLLRDLPAALGYNAQPPSALRTMAAAVWPSPLLFDPERGAWDRYRSARQHARSRDAFAARFHAAVSAS